mgnify:CR=1 FL=1
MANDGTRPHSPPPAGGENGGRLEKNQNQSGLLAAFSAFLLWGLLPVYWKALDSIDSFELLCHRILWSFVCLVPFMLFSGRLAGLAVFLRNPGHFFGLVFSGFLLAANWYLYIWAINSGMILEASLGYYINPLVSIVFGVVIFREKAGFLAWLGISAAVVGVAFQVVKLGHLPWVPLGLACSFAVYGLMRKLMQIQALPGLFMETLVVVPFAAGYLLWKSQTSGAPFLPGDPATQVLLVGAGVITTIPLLCFAFGARRIRMTSLGILQYVNPTCSFLLGVFVYKENITADGLITFVCIWIGLALYTYETTRKHSW